MVPIDTEAMEKTYVARFETYTDDIAFGYYYPREGDSGGSDDIRVEKGGYYEFGLDARSSNYMELLIVNC